MTPVEKIQSLLNEVKADTPQETILQLRHFIVDATDILIELERNTYEPH